MRTKCMGALKRGGYYYQSCVSVKSCVNFYSHLILIKFKDLVDGLVEDVAYNLYL